ncbi:MAG: hypothetical protein WDZ35_14200 [Crocinitomicaceae bacterium]
MHRILFPFLLLLLTACGGKDQSGAEGKWIQGNEEEKLETIERQFRGFDKAMVETGYRYQELYWAGQDENWEYANYQLEKIRTAIESGLQRRPKREESAQHFLTVALPEMELSVQEKDTVAFNQGFKMLTANCNACHAMESVPHFMVKTPLHRASPIRK